MSLPDSRSLEVLSLAGLRGLTGVLIAEVRRLQSTASGEAFEAEDQAVQRAGLSAARWITVDDTAAGPARKDGVTTQIGSAGFTTVRTGTPKSRETFLALLRAGHTDYVVNAATLDYMRGRGRGLAGPVIASLEARPARC